MKLVEEGLVSLSDPISKYLPEINNVEVLVGYDENDYPQTKKPYIVCVYKIHKSNLFSYRSNYGHTKTSPPISNR